MLNMAQRHIEAKWFAIKPVTPVPTEILRMGEILHVAIKNVTNHVISSINNAAPDELILRHVFVPVLKCILRFTSWGRDREQEQLDSVVTRVMQDITSYIVDDPSEVSSEISKDGHESGDQVE
jgi:hypothetical protein